MSCSGAFRVQERRDEPALPARSLDVEVFFNYKVRLFTVIICGKRGLSKDLMLLEIGDTSEFIQKRPSHVDINPTHHTGLRVKKDRTHRSHRFRAPFVHWAHRVNLDLVTLKPGYVVVVLFQSETGVSFDFSGLFKLEDTAFTPPSCYNNSFI
jgi:hypothetical protein